MSFFNKVFGASETANNVSKVNWIALESISQLDEIATLSSERAALIFKHSTRCSVSRMVLKQFENEFDLDDTVDVYFLDLLEHRDISNEIANRFGVNHQSPQLLLIKDGKSVYDVSHSDIDAGELKGKI